MNLHVAGAQFPVTSDVDRNVAAILRAIRHAHDIGADVLLTPEGSVSGYTHEFGAAKVAAASTALSAEAVQAGIGLALGTCFAEVAEDRNCYNALRFYSRAGASLGFHTKTLLCGTLTDPPRGEIERYAVRPLRTFDLDGLTVGGLICNDLWANPGCTPMPDPHLTQVLARMGARVIFHAVNGGRDGSGWSDVNWRYHEANLQMRAAAAGVWIVTVDSCWPTDIPCSAPSGVVAPDGRWVCRTEPRGEQYFDFTMDVG